MNLNHFILIKTIFKKFTTQYNFFLIFVSKPYILVFMKSIKIFLVCFFSLFTLFGCQKNSSDKQESKKILLGLALSSLTNTKPITSQQITCTASDPTSFNSLLTKLSTCQNCHSGTSPSANFDITSYTKVQSFVKPGDPTNSFLYKKVTTGSMSVHSNANINQAIYCWILNGANQ